MVLFKQHFSYLVQVRNRLQKVFTVTYWQFQTELSFLNQISFFSRTFNHQWQRRGKSDNISELSNVLVQIRLTQVKQNVISSLANLLYDLSHELSNELRLRILGNQEIAGACEIWVEIQPSAQCLFQKLNFGNTNQKTR